MFVSSKIQTNSHFWSAKNFQPFSLTNNALSFAIATQSSRLSYSGKQFTGPWLRENCTSYGYWFLEASRLSEHFLTNNKCSIIRHRYPSLQDFLTRESSSLAPDLSETVLATATVYRTALSPRFHVCIAIVELPFSAITFNLWWEGRAVASVTKQKRESTFKKKKSNSAFSVSFSKSTRKLSEACAPGTTIIYSCILRARH